MVKKWQTYIIIFININYDRYIQGQITILLLSYIVFETIKSNGLKETQRVKKQ